MLYLYAAVFGDCHIQYQGSSAVTTPEYGGIPRRSYYSCVANSNCNYEVHVLGSYESAQGGFQQHPTGYPDVYLTVTGISSRPLILVLSSYEPAAWTLHIPTGVEIDRVILVSLHNIVATRTMLWCDELLCFSPLQSSHHSNSVTASDGRNLTVENTLTYYAYGSDSGGGSTHQLLLHLFERFGSVSSFTGTYRADEWRITIDRSNTDPSK